MVSEEYTGTIWYYHCNDVGKYNVKPLQGIVVRYIKEVDVIVILVENSIDVFPIMLDSRYDIIAKDRKSLKKMKEDIEVRFSLKSKRITELK